MTARDDARSSSSEEAFALTTSRHFPEWLASIKHSLAFTTYRAGKVFFLGAKPDGKLSVFERSFSRCIGMGVSADTRSLLISSEYQIHRLGNILPEGWHSADGWRDRQATGGVVIDVASGDRRIAQGHREGLCAKVLAQGPNNDRLSAFKGEHQR